MLLVAWSAGADRLAALINSFTTAILYCNDGDWMQSLTAFGEIFDEELKFIHWRKRVQPSNLGRVVEPRTVAV